MRESRGRIAVLCLVICILLGVFPGGVAADDVTVSTHVTVVTETDAAPPHGGSGGNRDSSGGGSGDGGGGQTSPPADAVDDTVAEGNETSVPEMDGGRASSPVALQNNSGFSNGNLTCLACGGEAVVGNVLRIAGVFRNPGVIATNATLVGNVFRNNALVGVIDGEEQVVMGGSSENLSMNFTPQEPGRYLVRAHVVYGGRMTPISEVSFQVKEKGTVPFLFPFVGAVLLVGVYAVVRWQRRNL